MFSLCPQYHFIFRWWLHFVNSFYFPWTNSISCLSAQLSADCYQEDVTEGLPHLQWNSNYFMKNNNFKRVFKNPSITFLIIQ